MDTYTSLAICNWINTIIIIGFSSYLILNNFITKNNQKYNTAIIIDNNDELKNKLNKIKCYIGNLQLIINEMNEIINLEEDDDCECDGDYDGGEGDEGDCEGDDCEGDDCEGNDCEGDCEGDDCEGDEGDCEGDEGDKVVEGDNKNECDDNNEGETACKSNESSEGDKYNDDEWDVNMNDNNSSDDKTYSKDKLE